MKKGPMDELTALRSFLAGQREGLLATLDGITLEQATSTPTVSELSLFGIVKHCAFVERRWVLAAIGDRLVPGVFPPGERDPEFRAEAGEDLDWLRGFYAGVVRGNDVVLDAVGDLGALTSQQLDARRVLLHLIEEVAQHHGHADIIRESIDGRKDRD